MNIALAHPDADALDRIRSLLDDEPAYKEIWAADNGENMLELCVRQPPDLLLLGLDLCPVLDAVRTLPHAPRVLILAESVERQSALIFQVLGQGADDVARTPASGDSNEERRAFLKKLCTMARLIGRYGFAPGRPSMPTADRPVPRTGFPLVAVGASAGGPCALVAMLSRLPPHLGAAVVLVQHMHVDFADALTDWLKQSCAMNLVQAQPGMALSMDQVHAVLGSRHLALDNRGCLRVRQEDTPYQPSVNVMFESLARHWPGPGVGLLLTGMGDDGARGLLALKQAGWYTAAQDRETSTIYGMPKAACKLDAATAILPLDGMAPFVIQNLQAIRRTHYIQP